VPGPVTPGRLASVDGSIHFQKATIMKPSPLIIGIGGTVRPNSSSERVLQACLEELRGQGATTLAFCGRDLILPMYEPGATERSEPAARLVASVRDCDGLLIVSPGYHGSISGMIKNALDYMEDLCGMSRPYLHDKPVGCIACAYGWQAANSTLGALRDVAHALRGWPTPYGGAVNSSLELFEPATGAPRPELQSQLTLIASQIMRLASARPDYVQ